MRKFPTYICAAALLSAVLGACQAESLGQDRGEQTDAIKESLLESLEQYGIAFMGGNGHELATFALPEFIEMVGGVDRVAKAFDSFGSNFEVLEFSSDQDPDIIFDDGMWVSLVKFDVKARLPFESAMERIAEKVGVTSLDYIEMPGAMIALSRDEGKTWSLTTGNAQGREIVSMVAPQILDTFPVQEDVIIANGMTLTLMDIFQ